MNLSQLPTPITSFLKATEARDTAALLATFTSDATLTDMGEKRSGDAIRRWNDELYLGSNVVVHPLFAEKRDDDIVVTVAVDGDYEAHGVTEPFQLDYLFKLADDRIASLRMVETKLDLPRPVLSYVQATNMFDLDGMIACFADEAVVNDQQREHVGKAAIRAWAAQEIVGDHVTLYLTEQRATAAGQTLVAKVTGNYDKSGLPDPLTLRLYFSFADDVITQLIIVPVRDPR
jgi:ketosteroid isomerase-like protein